MKIHLTCFRNGEMRSGMALVIDGQMSLDEVKLRVAAILNVPHLSVDGKPMPPHEWVHEATLYHSPPPSSTGQWSAPQPVERFENLYDQDTVVLAVRELLKLPSNSTNGQAVMQPVMVAQHPHVMVGPHGMNGMMPMPMGPNGMPVFPPGVVPPPGVAGMPMPVTPQTPISTTDENELYRKKKRLTDDHGKPIKLKDANKKRRLNPRCSTITACIEQVRKFRADCKLKNKSLTNLNSTYVIHARFEKAEQLQPGWSHSADERKLGSADAHEEAKQIISNKSAGGGPQRWPTRAGRTATGKNKEGRGTPAAQQQAAAAAAAAAAQQQQQQQAAMAAQHAAAMQQQAAAAAAAAHGHGMPFPDPLLGQPMTAAQMHGMALPRPRSHANDDNGALTPVHPVIWRDKDLCNLHATRSLDTLTLHHLKKIMEAVRLAPPKGAKVDFVNKLASYLANCICCRHQPFGGLPNIRGGPLVPGAVPAPGVPGGFPFGAQFVVPPPGGRGHPMPGMPNLPPNMPGMPLGPMMHPGGIPHPNGMPTMPMVNAAASAASAAGGPHILPPNMKPPNMPQNMPQNIPQGMLHPVLMHPPQINGVPQGMPPVGVGRPPMPIAMPNQPPNGIPNNLVNGMPPNLMMARGPGPMASSPPALPPQPVLTNEPPKQ